MLKSSEKRINNFKSQGSWQRKKVKKVIFSIGKGSLTPDEIFNVVKLQNGIDCSKDEVGKATNSVTVSKGHHCF